MPSLPSACHDDMGVEPSTHLVARRTFSSKPVADARCTNRSFPENGTESDQSSIVRRLRSYWELCRPPSVHGTSVCTHPQAFFSHPKGLFLAMWTCINVFSCRAHGGLCLRIPPSQTCHATRIRSWHRLNVGESIHHIRWCQGPYTSRLVAWRLMALLTSSHVAGMAMGRLMGTSIGQKLFGRTRGSNS
jgi:hypothetical protein